MKYPETARHSGAQHSSKHLCNYRVQNLLLEAMIVRGSRAAVCPLEVISALIRMRDFNNEKREVEGQGLVHVGLDGWR